CLSDRTGGGHRAARLYRADRHDNPRLCDLWQFSRSVDLDRRCDHHCLGPLHRLPRAAAIRGPLISEPVMDFTIPDELLELKKRTENFVRQEILARENDRRLGPHGPSDDFRRELVALARRAGLLSPHVGREYGWRCRGHPGKAADLSAGGSRPAAAFWVREFARDEAICPLF